MTSLISALFGAASAALFVGFFAYKVNEPPLTIIVLGCLALMVYVFLKDLWGR